ncbi:hypothetical protein BHE74_00054511 [Ensete ventricosum]|nr:hypothetical protein BHE74_00054511 [Ensete ventricosum]
MKAGHDLNMAVTEGSLAAIRERYNISAEYGLHVLQPERTCLGLEVLLSFWGFKLDWSAHPIGNVPPYLSEEESVLVGRLKGILFSSCAIKEMIELWLVEVGLSPASRGADWMDLDDLRGMPRASGGKTPTAHSTISTQETGEGPPIEAPRPSSKRSSDAPVQPDDLAQRHKEVKILSRMHKSCHGEGGSQSHSKGKEPAVSVEEPEGQAESLDKAGTSVFVHPKSMKDL